MVGLSQVGLKQLDGFLIVAVVDVVFIESCGLLLRRGAERWRGGGGLRVADADADEKRRRNDAGFQPQTRLSLIELINQTERQQRGRT